MLPLLAGLSAVQGEFPHFNVLPSRRHTHCTLKRLTPTPHARSHTTRAAIHSTSLLQPCHLLLASLPPPPAPSSAPQLHASAPVLCLLEQADYQECLHREKLKRRIAVKALEVNASKEAPAEHGHGHGGH